MSKLTRTLEVRPVPMRGLDVKGTAITLHRYLQTGKLDDFNKQPERVQTTYGIGKAALAERANVKAGLPKSRKVTPRLFEKMEQAGAVDKRAEFYMDTYEREHPELVLCYPTVSPSAYICQGLHQTDGLLGNWAIDFCSPPLTKIVAVESGVIEKLSGNDPSDDSGDPFGVYGWSVYLRSLNGYVYYYTHLGQRTSLVLGQRVGVGFVLGRVGDQTFRPDHLHLGCTSPLGERDAKRRMEQVAAAPRLVGV